MKTPNSAILSVALLSSALIIGLVSACNTTQQRIAANTISALDTAATGAVDNYFAATIKGIAPTNGIPQVSRVYNIFHKDLIVAIDFAQNNTNALASDNLAEEAADVLDAVAATFPPAVPKNNVVRPSKNKKLTP